MPEHRWPRPAAAPDAQRFARPRPGTPPALSGARQRPSGAAGRQQGARRARPFTALLGTGWGWYNITDLNRNAHVLHISGLTTPPAVAAIPSDAPRVHGSAQNILIVGIDSRAGLIAAQRHEFGVGDDTSTSTDTIRLVHIPADGSKATLISIPRDSWVHIPGYAHAKINAAYADGYYLSGHKGARALQEAAVNTLVATVKELTGVAIDPTCRWGSAASSRSCARSAGFRSTCAAA